MRALLLALVAFTLTSPGRAEQVANLPAPTGYIDDYAHVLSNAGKAQADAVCHEIHAKTKAQIFVVTIQTLEDNSIQMFANDLFHQWKIGEKKTDRGVLLLFAIKEHKWRIEVGYGLEGILNDAKVGRIGREMVPLLKQSDYDSAVSTGVNAVAKVIADDAGVTLAPPAVEAPSPPAAAAPPQPVASGTGSGAIWALLPMLVIFGILGFFVFLVILNRRRRYVGSSGPYYDPGAQTGFIPTDNSSTYIAPDNSSSSSSVFDTSGSSDTFSGGDGGDSGGGGADGSW